MATKVLPRLAGSAVSIDMGTVCLVRTEQTDRNETMSAVDRFIEEMGLIVQEGGGARISGRIFGLLVVEGKELSLQKISERLGVSRASVSTNARQLAKRGILKLTSHPGDRQDYYEVTNVAQIDVIGELAVQFRRHASVVKVSAAAVRDENPDAASRIDDLTRFYTQSADLLESWAENLRNLHEDKGEN